MGRMSRYIGSGLYYRRSDINLQRSVFDASDDVSASLLNSNREYFIAELLPYSLFFVMLLRVNKNYQNI